MAFPEKRQLKGYEHKNDYFSPTSDCFGKPFRRYLDAPLTAKMVVWNVFDREPVPLKSYTFEDHWRTVLRVLREAEAPSDFIARIEKAAKPFSLLRGGGKQ